jgi:hypothetical protein
MIAGLARAGRTCGRLQWIQAAQEAADFIRKHLWKNGHLLATCKDDRAHLNAYLDDHAFLLQGLLELLQADFRKTDLEFAIAIADALLSRFEDTEHGGFFFTSHDHEALIQRPKSIYDNATPSGNGIAAFTLQRLGHLVGNTRYLSAAENTLRAFAATANRNPAACPSLMMALEEYLVPPTLVIVRGPTHAMRNWQTCLNAQWLPHSLTIHLPESEQDLPQALDRPLQKDVNAWVCRGVECLPAITELNALLEAVHPLGKQPKTRL